MSKLERPDELFAGRHFDREVILLCVRWYLRFRAGNFIAQLIPDGEVPVESLGG